LLPKVPLMLIAVSGGELCAPETTCKDGIIIDAKRSNKVNFLRHEKFFELSRALLLKSFNITPSTLFSIL
jgi:hypothetical protein